MAQLLRFSVCIVGASIAWLPTIADAAPPAQTTADGLHRDAVHESNYVRIGGIDQWIQIRGDNRANPVLLWLNGGPGVSTIRATPAFRSWERVFTMVMWDQRGEGKTFQRNGTSEANSMTIPRMVDDGIELARYLCTHLHRRKIILLGHSWGSILGIHMAKTHPELFLAYVGTGQATERRTQLEAGYEGLLARAKPGSSAAQELTALGPPPWKSEDAYDAVNAWAAELDPPPQPMSADDDEYWRSRVRVVPAPSYLAAGIKLSSATLSPGIAKENLPNFATEFSVPIIFIQGYDDLLTTTEVVKDYFNSIAAPSKRFVELPLAGHDAIFGDTNEFLEQLVEQLRSLGIIN
jgi:pimeloyl-ACP methyl ester carboxylesterase